MVMKWPIHIGERVASAERVAVADAQDRPESRHNGR